MVRIHLPPNLVAAAARDAVAVRVELHLSAAPPAELLPLLALLQRWCGTQPPGVLQLNRRQLGELSRAAAGQRIFVEGGTAGAWRHDALLREPAATPAPATSGGAARARRSPAKAHVSSAEDGFWPAEVLLTQKLMARAEFQAARTTR